MNIHHLELFYFIATHGGITEAARKMPYGIQQPAISAQILRLEEHLGVKLFQRRPFHLTPAGRELYEFAAPFFSRVQETSERLRGETRNACASPPSPPFCAIICRIYWCGIAGAFRI